MRNTDKKDINESADHYFPHVDKILVDGHFSETEKEFLKVHEGLSQMTKSSGLGKGKDAKKAMKAIEMSMDLLKELLSWKKTGVLPQNLQQNGLKQGVKSTEGGVVNLQLKK